MSLVFIVLSLWFCMHMYMYYVAIQHFHVNQCSFIIADVPTSQWRTKVGGEGFSVPWWHFMRVAFCRWKNWRHDHSFLFYGVSKKIYDFFNSIFFHINFFLFEYYKHMTASALITSGSYLRCRTLIRLCYEQLFAETTTPHTGTFQKTSPLYIVYFRPHDFVWW